MKIIALKLQSMALISVVCPHCQSDEAVLKGVASYIKHYLVDESSEGERAEEPADPSTVDTDPNPLNPAGESLDTLIQMQVNDDLWATMMGELSCLDAT